MLSTPQLFNQVPSQFPQGECRIAFVGEAPGTEERLNGFPLVGPSGREFDRLLRVAGLAVADSDYPVPYHARHSKRLIQNRAPYYVGNVFNEQLPDNQIKNWCVPATEKASLGDDYDLPYIPRAGYLRPDYLSHLARLRAELALVRPTLIVPLGGTALWAFTGASDITVNRGAAQMATRICPGVKLLPTYHPAVVFKDAKLFMVVVQDLIKAQYEAGFADLRLHKRQIHIRPEARDLPNWLQAIRTSSIITVDIETAGGQITCIGFGTNAEEAFVLPFVNYEETDGSYWRSATEEALAWEFAREALNLPQPKLLQNGLYDLYWLIRKAGIFPRNYCFDTRLTHHSLYPELPKSLAFMGATYANAGAWKSMRTQSKMEEKKDA